MDARIAVSKKGEKTKIITVCKKCNQDYMYDPNWEPQFKEMCQDCCEQLKIEQQDFLSDYNTEKFGNNKIVGEFVSQSEVLTYPKFVDACKRIAEIIDKNPLTFDIKNIFGIRRGGLIPAVYISHILNIPMVSVPDKNSIIINDISDSGTTLKPYKDDGYKIATIYCYKKSIVCPDIWVYEKKDKWVQFPWEVK